jgi:hypothetical protein
MRSTAPLTKFPPADKSGKIGVPVWLRGSGDPLPEVPFISRKGDEALEISVTELDSQHMYVVWKNTGDSKSICWQLARHDVAGLIRRLMACVRRADDVFSMHSDVCAALPDEAARMLLNAVSTQSVPDSNGQAAEFHGTFIITDPTHGGTIRTIDCASHAWSVRDEDAMKAAGLAR